jgi:membrane protein involved in colicin uptake
MGLDERLAQQKMSLAEREHQLEREKLDAEIQMKQQDMAQKRMDARVQAAQQAAQAAAKPRPRTPRSPTVPVNPL